MGLNQTTHALNVGIESFANANNSSMKRLRASTIRTRCVSSNFKRQLTIVRDDMLVKLSTFHSFIFQKYNELLACQYPDYY